MEVARREALEIEMMGIKGENAELLTEVNALREEEVAWTRDLEKTREALLISSHILQGRALKAAEDSRKITHAAISLKLESNPCASTGLDFWIHSDQEAQVGDGHVYPE